VDDRPRRKPVLREPGPVARLTASEYFTVVATASPSKKSASRRRGRRIGRPGDRPELRTPSGRPARALLIVNASDTTTSTQAMSIARGVSPESVGPILADRAD
jgi:hypothetical protein